MPNIHCRIKDYIQPFERELALREMRALCPGPVLPVDGPEQTASVFSIEANGSLDELRNGLTYWRSVGLTSGDLTSQIRSEATSTAAKHDIFDAPLASNITFHMAKMPRRRCLRYATHGLHEYRGKFFPQLVRSLINIGQVPSKGIVVDPMCGSGTTLVETRLADRTAYGLDMNPLSVFITQVKCQALSLSVESLLDAYEHLQSNLKNTSAEIGHHATLPLHDQEYLLRWFAPTTLRELDHVYAAIQLLGTNPIRGFFLVCLSNVLRSVSWQKKDDLRVRREVVEFDEGEVVCRFLIQAQRAVSTVSAFIAERGRVASGYFNVIEDDARQAADILEPIVGKVDAVITSPPYATALPYIDTDRLSLIYLGLLSRTDHAQRDRIMIGNREVSTRSRNEYWVNYLEKRNLLPTGVCSVIDRINLLNDHDTVGFRRKNVAALLSKYFFDMQEVLLNIRKLLRPGGIAFLVVGNNRTTAGGELIQIRTAEHLEAISEDLDFKVVDTLSMDMLPSRDIFRKNAVPSEKIIRLQAP